MKKLLLSLAVSGTFILYSLHQRKEMSAVNVISPNLSGTDNNDGSSNPNSSAPTQAPSTNTPGLYKDGIYTGDVADAFYGNVQVQVTVKMGKITDVRFLQYPNERQTSLFINGQAMPYLKEEAISAQNANVDIVSGATQTSRAFIESLGSALSQAK